MIFWILIGDEQKLGKKTNSDVAAEEGNLSFPYRNGREQSSG